MITLSAILAIIFLAFRGRAIDSIRRHRLVAGELKAGCEKYGLSTSRMLVRRDWGLALDRDKSKMLYVRMQSHELISDLIHLGELLKCQVLRNHEHSRHGATIHERQEGRLKQILLEIQLTAPGGRYLIPFYNDGHDKLSEMKMLFQKAWHWQRMIAG